MFIAHLDHGGRLAHQRIPFPLDILGSRYEYLLMRVLGRMTDAEWLYRYRPTRALVDALANRLLIPLISGEVLVPGEVERMVHRLEEDGYLMAVGVCECRHGENNLEGGSVEGVDPNYTCVMIGDWGRGHLYSWPGEYRRAGAAELAEKARFWHERGRVLSAWGMISIHGFVVSYCHCRPDYCVPLRNQLKRGNRVFSPGYSYATVDPDICRGTAECEWGCAGRCHFQAISVVNGKAYVDRDACHGCGHCFCYCPTGAAISVRRDGYELTYCASDLVSVTRE